MFTVSGSFEAIALCLITMVGWGSWANTQKLAGKEHWPFELYYWDYAIGVALAGVFFALTMGNLGSTGMGTVENLGTASGGAVWAAVESGALFNIANILLVVAIDAAGLALAFPVGVGLALVIGTVASYYESPKGNAVLLGAGVVLVVLAMIISAVASSRVQRQQQNKTARGVAFAFAAGCLMGFFYP